MLPGGLLNALVYVDMILGYAGYPTQKYKDQCRLVWSLTHLHQRTTIIHPLLHKVSFWILSEFNKKKVDIQILSKENLALPQPLSLCLDPVQKKQDSVKLIKGT